MLELTRNQRVLVRTSRGWQRGLVCREVKRGIWAIRISDPQEALLDEKGRPVIYTHLDNVRSLQDGQASEKWLDGTVLKTKKGNASKERLLQLVRRIEPLTKSKDVFRCNGLWYWHTDKGAVVLGKSLPVAIECIELQIEEGAYE